METVFAPEIQSLAQANKLTYDETLKLREQNYQTAVYLIFALMGQFVQTEVHCYSTAMYGGCSTQKRCFDKVETRSQNYTRTYSFDDATGRADCIVCKRLMLCISLSSSSAETARRRCNCADKREEVCCNVLGEREADSAHRLFFR